MLFLLLLAFFLAYLPHIHQFGFYKDDWHMIYNGHSFGPNRITDSFLIDRPMMGQLNRVTYTLLGDSPLAWAVFAFAARLEGVLAFYVLVRLLWPRRLLPAALISLLFAVYPGFLQLPNAATFQNHFIGYGLALTSIALTAAALRARGSARLLLTLPALLFTAGYLLIYEYMIGLEALRVMVIWLVTAQRAGVDWRKVFRKVVLRSLPYMAVTLAFVTWRLLIFSSDRPATNTELLLGKYLSQPALALANLLVSGVQDFVESLWLAWSVPLYNLWSSASLADVAGGLLLGIGGGVAIWLGLLRLFSRGFEEASQEDGETDWAKAAMLIGALATLGALLPVLAAGRSIAFKDQFDRYTLHATAGVSLLLGGVIYTALRSRYRLALVALLVGLSIPVHFLNGAYWGRFWAVQREFWWQVAWRAPGLADQTVLMPLLPAGYRLAEDYEVFSAANLVYHPEEAAFRIYGEILNQDTARKVILGEESYRFIRFFELTRDFKQALVVEWAGEGSCAHFVDSQRLELSAASDPLIFLVGPYSRIDRVLTSEPPAQPLAAVFGREPGHNWCYYYQQADLARQRGDWLAVLALLKQAESIGLRPVDVVEWLPFYEAFHATGDAAGAGALAARIRADRDTWNAYCHLSDPTGALRNSPAAAALCDSVD